MNPKQTSRTPWKQKDIIRDKTTGHPYLVIHVFIDTSTEIIDLEDKNYLRRSIHLMPSGYDQYVLDKDMVHSKEGFNYVPLVL